MINSAGDFGPMIFGTGERLLLPFGLHHILVALIRFTEAGGTLDVCGHSVSGALTIFQAQLSCPTTHGFSESATRFLSQGKMPAFLGGLPGAALAMYHCARPENRHKIKGLLISGVIACVVGGTTEPLEFLFLFVAPVLYVIHALLTGLGFTIMAVLGVTIGNTDGNIIDFVVFGILHGLATKWYLVPVVAAIWFAVYYAIFRFAITRFNLKTPGRDIDTAASVEKAVAGTIGKSGYNVPAILAALGGVVDGHGEGDVADVLRHPGKIDLDLLVVAVPGAGEVIAQVLHGAAGMTEVAVEHEVLGPGDLPVISQQKRGGIQVKVPAGIKGVHVPAQAHDYPAQSGIILGKADFLSLFQTDRHTLFPPQATSIP